MIPPKLERLRKRSQFLFVRAGAKRARASLIVEARRREAGGAIGVGFTASRKAGGAVVRNRARRRMREAARRILPQFGLAGVDYVLVARPATAEAPWTGLLDDLQDALISLAPELDGAPRGGRPAKPRARKRATQRAPADRKEGKS